MATKILASVLAISLRFPIGLPIKSNSLSLILSYDSIMRPPYEITTTILKLISQISEKLGSASANYLDVPSPRLRKQNKIKTIHSSLSIEGNTLTEEHITALIEHKRVMGPKKDIDEVLNAISIYEELDRYTPNSLKSFLKAHKTLMRGLVDGAGSFRTQGVGIVKGTQVKHVAPPYENVPGLMNNLFTYLQYTDELCLIKSCVFHYEMEFIHPFLDGNGRMGRLWQTLILKEEYPLFEFLPFETLIHQTQIKYYQALARSDNAGSSTIFIEYMLAVINESLIDFISNTNPTMTDVERLDYFIHQKTGSFSRKEYMNVFKAISSATASRDLKKGITLGYFKKQGEKNKTIYVI